ncbi:twin-arginine translocation signal domain-containing protein, partial [Clostridium perfringens]
MKFFSSPFNEKSSRRSFLTKTTLGVTGAMLATSYNGLASSVERTPKSSAPSDLKIT